MSGTETKDKMLQVVLRLEEVHLLLKDENDFGDGTGFCNELDRVWRDADAFADMVLRRCEDLQRRYLRVQKDAERAAMAKATEEAKEGTREVKIMGRE